MKKKIIDYLQFILSKIQHSLQLKLFIFLAGFALLIFLLAVIPILNRTHNRENELAFKEARNRADCSASKVKSYFDLALQTTKTLAQGFSAYTDFPVETRRQTLTSLLKKIVESNPQYIAAFSYWEPNSVDGNDMANTNTPGNNETGRFALLCYMKYGKTAISSISEEEIKKADYYKTIKESGNELLLNPYYAKFGDKKERYIASVVAPVIHNHKFCGIIGLSLPIDKLDSYIAGFDSLASIFANNGSIVAHFNRENVGKSIFLPGTTLVNEQKKIKEIISNGEKGNFTSWSISLKQPVYFSMSPIVIGKSSAPWYVGYALPVDDALAYAKSIRKGFLFTAIFLLILAMAGIYYLTIYITKPISEGIAFAKQLSEGDLSKRLISQSKDEIGILAGSLNDVAQKFSTLIEEITAVTQMIATTSQIVSTSTSDITSGSFSEEISVKLIATSMENMTLKINENSENSKQTKQISVQAANGIVDASRASEKSLQSVRDIADRIALINDIAIQTNVLALNTTVEASRAGIHGKGFSVIAEEIRRLAEHSRVTADEIVELAVESLSATENAVEQMMNAIPKVQRTSQLIQTIAAASLEQDSNSQLITNAVQTLEQMAVSNTQTANLLTDNCKELSEQTDLLMNLVARFKIFEKKSDIEHNLHKKNIKDAKNLKDDLHKKLESYRNQTIKKQEPIEKEVYGVF